jgi:hypothetical protein
MENTVTDKVRVAPNIRLVNKYLRKAKNVAVSSLHPVYGATDPGVLEAFNLSLEGPPQHISYLHRLLSEANLKIS